MFLTFGAIYSCVNSNDDPVLEESTSKTQAQETTKYGQRITSSKAIELSTNYDKKYAAQSKLIAKEDNRSVLYSLSVLNNYIAYLENEDSNIDGIRVYLGAYADSNLTTMFLTPTINGVDDTSRDPLNYGNLGHPPKKEYAEANGVITGKLKEGQHISPARATQLCDNYDTKHANLSKAKDDNRSVLYSISVLKEYFAYLENANAKIDGIRFYLGAYADSNLTTIFLTPTIKGIDDTSRDPLNLGSIGQPPKSKYGDN